MKESTGSGMTFLDLLTVLLIGLKLTGKISWSWWAVTAPLWIQVIIGVIAVIIILLRED